MKQHLAAICMLFDWLVFGQVIPMNPAASVRGPKHVVKKGKTVVLSTEDARSLIDSIDVSTLIGLRDRALIGVMVYSFAPSPQSWGCASATITKTSGSAFWKKAANTTRCPPTTMPRLTYIEAAGIGEEKQGVLFRSSRGKTNTLTLAAMHRVDVFRMIRRRAAAAGIDAAVCCHTFRATGITAYLENGGTIEKAQAIAAHESPRTTKILV